ncbi:hypothetical protein GCM10023321_50130 [Pseudonocardia eucalypti]|uniref:Uncharacterized protein n=1 Tax=Pseudonocardia eucalypti TaxID=648755 RepID=A0ABP9QK79_9PSEU
MLKSATCASRAALNEALKTSSDEESGVIAYLPAHRTRRLADDEPAGERATLNRVIADLGVATR